jgi:hypothetical protein
MGPSHANRPAYPPDLTPTSHSVVDHIRNGPSRLRAPRPSASQLARVRRKACADGPTRSSTAASTLGRFPIRSPRMGSGLPQDRHAAAAIKLRLWAQLRFLSTTPTGFALAASAICQRPLYVDVSASRSSKICSTTYSSIIKTRLGSVPPMSTGASSCRRSRHSDWLARRLHQSCGRHHQTRTLRPRPDTHSVGQSQVWTAGPTDPRPRTQGRTNAARGSPFRPCSADS